ncbi:MAG: serine/threonine-protein phosphatase [Alphaproteobacteria bacterium]|nr:serine/threonine-protein phosphatase [Alphaproteobacteria bacterium]
MKRAFGYRSEQRKRSENQDSFGVFDFDGYTLAIVCDGMGGHVGGAQASSLAVRTVHDCIEELAAGGDYPEALRVALERANQAIYEAARKNHRLMGMGTTAVAAILTGEGFVHIAHVGDSRAYLINEGQAVQVTRDHTMVNLFVDAELLTPEDAATHPEAHVLSRSLGVERQVEVELSDPIELADNDVVLLCSDGVHGVVTDWELGSIDWAAPEPGVKHVLDIVDAREGDDNATAVAILIGDAPGMGTSPVPDPKSIDAQVAALRDEAQIQMMDDYESASDPDSYRTEPSAPPREDLPSTPSYLDEEPEPPSPRETQTIGTSVDEPVPDQKQATPRPLQRGKDEKLKKKKKGASPARLLVPLGVIGLMAIVSLGAIAFLTRPDPTDEDESTIIVDGDPSNVRPKPGTEPIDPAVPEPDDSFFRARIPDPPRRLPHRPLRYTQPPPRGQSQFVAVQAARDHKCAESLDAVQEAMALSPDHAKLYSQAWFCFQESHARQLVNSKVENYEQFAELESHFRGWPEFGDPEDLEWTAEDKRLPLWYRPARDGVEYRLEAWASSSEDDLMREVMIDLKGEPSIADDFAADVLVEAQAAVALSRAEPRTPDIEEAWARRVYVVSSALKGRVGKLLRTHRPELVPQLEEMLETATTAQAEGPAVPGNIAKAHKVGTGEEPPPTIVVRPGPKVDPLGEEPDLGPEPGGTKVKGKIYK